MQCDVNAILNDVITFLTSVALDSFTIHDTFYFIFQHTWPVHEVSVLIAYLLCTKHHLNTHVDVSRRATGLMFGRSEPSTTSRLCVYEKQMLRRDCAYTQARLSLRRPPM